MPTNKKTFGFSLLDKTSEYLDIISQITGLNRSQVIDRAVKELNDTMVKNGEISPQK